MTTNEGAVTPCREVEDTLAQILEGTAPATLYEHIADCDACRDLRHDAVRASELVAQASADFRAPEARGAAAEAVGWPDALAGRLEATLVETGRVSGATRTGGAGARTLVSAADAAAASRASSTVVDGTVRGMGSVTPEEARAMALAKAPSSRTLATGDDRKGGELATAPTAFAPLSAFGPGSSPSEREPTQMLAAVPERAALAGAHDPGAAHDTIVGSLVDPPAVTQEATAFVVAPAGKTEPASAPFAPPPRQLKTDPLPEAMRGAVREARSGSGVVAAASGVVSATSDHGGQHRSAPGASAPPGASASAASLQAPRAAPPRSSRVLSLFRRRPLILGAVGAMAAAAAAGFALRGKIKNDPIAQVEAPWSGSVAAVSRASADKNGGLEACTEKRGCWAIAAGAEIKPGWKLKTDARTRAHVKLGDGTELAVDRGSEIDLSASANRTARLVSGSIVADVAHVDGASAAHFAFPHGDVEVLGTKLALTADADRATVEVVRGAVRVHADGGKAIEVRAGEEATLVRGAEPTVASSTSLSDVLEWSDRSEEEVDAPVLRGLGELRARKPGETKERDRAVHLAKHSVKVRVVDVVARTEVDETFTNDTDEELEGIFRFPLPPGAQIERLSLEVDGKLLDGAFVDRERGAAIWRGVIQNAAPKAPKPREEIIWVPGPWRDPALLEWQRGGRFELKIFPIPKRGSRRVVLTYTQTVDQAAGIRRFTYPLAHDQSGTTKIDSFDLDLQVLGHDKELGVKTRGYELTSAANDGAGERRVLHADAFVPSGDLTVEYALPERDRQVTAWAYKMDAAPAAQTAPSSPAGKAAPVAGAPKTPEEKAAVEAAQAMVNDASPYVAISLRPKLPRWQEAKGRVHAIVVDSSRSMIGERYSRATRLASSIVREMDRRDTFVLIACDTTCRPLTSDGSRGASQLSAGAASAGQVERFLGSLEPDGGSDLSAAVSAARAAAGSLGGKELRILYLGDGTPTVGPTRGAHLEAAVKTAMPAGDATVVAVALGADADMTSLQAMARGGGGVVVPYVPGQKVSSAAVDVLAAAYGVVLRDVEVELPTGLAQVTPARIDPIRAGGESFVLARMSGSSEVAGTVKVRGKVAGERFEQTYPLKVLATTSAGNAFVPRMYAAAKIAELERSGGDSVVRPAVVELSRRFAVASRFTSLLVLESEAMFKAFGLERNSVGPSFTGEEQAESSSADAEGGVADDESQREAGYGAGSGRLGPPAKPKSRESGAVGGGGFDGDAPGRSRAEADRPNQAPQGLAASGPQTKAGAAQPSFDPPAEPKAEAEASKDDKAARKKSPPAATPAPSASSGVARPLRRPPLDTANPWSDSGRRMVPMRRIFERKASFDGVNTLAQQNAAKLVVAESALSAAPDSRDRTVELFSLFATSGRLGEAQELTARWSGRDALDPDAITARADLAARQGDRERAIRVLGGLTDVRPGDKAPQLRLADLHDAAGNAALACQHRVTAAELAPGEAKIVADAVRCARNLGQVDLAGLLKADAPAKVREAIEKLLVTAPTATPSASAVRGDVQISADWTGGGDLDISLIDAQGRRISWMGSPSKATTVSARDVQSPRSEALGLTGLPAGSYVVEISRAAGGDVGEPARGEITLRLPGETRKVPFALTGARAEVGSVKVFFTSRLVPVDDFGWR